MTETNKGSPKYAIPLHVAQVAMKYGKTVSKGIQEMERRIQAQQAQPVGGDGKCPSHTEMVEKVEHEKGGGSG